MAIATLSEFQVKEIKMYQTNPPVSPKETLPTMYDLPSEDPEEPGLPDEFHLLQPELLRSTFRPPSYTEDNVYEQILRIPYYFVYNRYTDEFHCFGLVMNRYQPLSMNGLGVWLEEAELGLGLWEGEYQGLTRQWLRWYDRDNNWLPTPEEREKQRADSAELEVAKLRQLLLAQGISLPNDQ